MMKLEDLKITVRDTRKSGGQHVGIIPNGVCVIHLPTKIEAYCETERSQSKNKDVAMMMIETALELLNWHEADSK